MKDKQRNPPFDLVIFGATGFTGGLTAEYLGGHLPHDARWALAGRNQNKLESVQARVTTASPAAPIPELLYADVYDHDSLRRIAESAQVVVTTVGPYLQYGEPLVAACAASGTDYVDLSGESEFVDRMYVAHHSTAVESGSRLVHACGFESVPHDLGVLYTLKQLPSGEAVTIRGVVRTNATISSGTFQSALGQLSRIRNMRQAAVKRRRIESHPAGRAVGGKASRPHWDPYLDTWLLPLPTIDPKIVKLSAASSPAYGPDFTYTHHVAIKRLPKLLGVVASFSVFIVAVQIRPLRRLLGSWLRKGEGPSQERRARSFFTVDFIGTGGGRQVHTQMRGGDPGYTETSTIAAEAAMCLAFDNNPAVAGQVTTATAMGEKLMDRLINSGIEFRTMQLPARTESLTSQR